MVQRAQHAAPLRTEQIAESSLRKASSKEEDIIEDDLGRDPAVHDEFLAQHGEGAGQFDLAAKGRCIDVAADVLEADEFGEFI